MRTGAHWRKQGTGTTANMITVALLVLVAVSAARGQGKSFVRSQSSWVWVFLEARAARCPSVLDSACTRLLMVRHCFFVFELMLLFFRQC